jgi:peptidoglycan/xylan/chitin deacetylase (PgdA/CDA1 family)
VTPLGAALVRLRGAARAATAALRRRADRGVILLYHRIAGPRMDPLELDVREERFAAQLAILARDATVLPLDEFEDRRRAGTLPPRATAITFDDGYADNQHLAAPALAAAGLPATVFVTTGMTGANREFWWDDIERVAFSDRHLEPPVPGMSLSWKHADGAPRAAGAWRVLSGEALTPRHRLYRELFLALRAIAPAAREARLAALRAWAGVPDDARPSHRTMTLDELLALAATPGITIGAHTITHPVLKLLPVADQQRELAGSGAQLAGWLGHPVRAVAYPFGTVHDVSADTWRAARDAGFDYALINEPRTAWRWTSRWELPRFLVRDWDAAEFTGRLAAWRREG